MGMRLYLSGAISVIVPEAMEHSLSPPTGGLKFFSATGAISRIKILEPWPPVTQVYYWLRYFNGNQVREALLITLIATLVPSGFDKLTSKFEKVLFPVKALLHFPFRVIGIFRSYKKANDLLKEGPKIPPGRGVEI